MTVERISIPPIEESYRGGRQPHGARCKFTFVKQVVTSVMDSLDLQPRIQVLD